MVPPTLLRPLARLRWQERFLRLLWGGARVLAVVAFFLAGCCFLDWIVDRFDDTPMFLRVNLLLGQVVIAALALFFWVVWPLLVRLPNTKLALWVEAAWPAFRHRLISAVELNRPGAPTAGMSPGLIAHMTREAEAEAARADFGKALDRSRWRRSAAVAAPVLIAVLVVLLVLPETAWALLRRQALQDVDIPRSVHLENVTEDVLPVGEPVLVKIAASGPGVKTDAEGTLVLKGQDGGEPRVLTLRHDPEVSRKLGKTVFVAEVPPSTTDLEFLARLGDGRLRSHGTVRFEPRPAVTGLDVTAQLPGYFGTRPNGRPYEEHQDRGDVVGYAGSQVRVRAHFNKPVARAKLELLASGDQGEFVRRDKVVTLKPAATHADFSFDLAPEETGYRLSLVDERGFDSRPMPPRLLGVKKDTPPQVTLLREVYRDDGDAGPLEDYAQDGTPVALTPRAQLRIAYRVTSDVPLGRAWLRYRIYHKPGETPRWWRTGEVTEIREPLDDPWENGLWLAWPFRGDPTKPPRPGELSFTEYPVPKAQPDAPAPQWLPEEGVYDQWRFNLPFEFHALPSPDPDRYPGRRVGGGRVHLLVATIPGLQEGDRLAYFVEVSDRRPTPQVGRSPIRVTEVVDTATLVKWKNDKDAVTARLNDLRTHQDEVFDPMKPKP